MSALEAIARKGLAGRLTPEESVHLPMVFANRGTFTLPVFNRFGPAPLAVLRMDAARSLVGHESRVLKLIAKYGEDRLTQSVPQIIWEGNFGLRHVSLQTFLPGCPIGYPRRTGRLKQQLTALVEWLSTLYRIPVKPDDLAQSESSDVFALYRNEEAFHNRISGSELSVPVWEALKRLKQANVRQVLNHADLHPGNALMRAGRLAVLDWEYASVSWPPFDWFYYVCSAFVDRHRKAAGNVEATREVLQHILNGRNRRSGIVRDLTYRLLRNIGLTADLYPPFFTLGVFNFLLRRFDVPHLPSFLPLLEKTDG